MTSNLPGFLEQFPYLGLFLLLFLGFLGLPFPEDTTLILTGFLIAEDVVKPVPAILVLYITMVALDFAAYFIGKKYGRQIVTHRKFRKVLTPERLSALENKFDKWGTLFIIVARHIVILRTQILLAAGVVRMRPYKFIIADLIAAPLTMFLMIGAGYVGGNSLEIVKKDLSRIEHVTILSVVVLSGLYLLYRQIRTRH